MIKIDADYLLDNISIPIIITQAVFDANQTIVDILVVYVNKQYELQTRGFTTPGAHFSEFKRSCQRTPTGFPYSPMSLKLVSNMKMIILHSASMYGSI